jgi:transcriptional regulator with XRE-family HTH domain
VAARERPVDRGQRLGTTSLRYLGDGIRQARRSLGLSTTAVAAAVGISAAEVSRIERAVAPWVTVVTLARLAAAVGLELSMRLYPGGPPIRDVPQLSMLDDFAADLAASLRWDTEVPLPISGDLRAWDGMVRGDGWRFGVEAESAPRDGQALVRRLQLKLRDGEVDGVILLVRDTRQTRLFLETAEQEIASLLPYRTRAVMEALRGGRRPPGNGVVTVPRRRVGQLKNPTPKRG